MHAQPRHECQPQPSTTSSWCDAARSSLDVNEVRRLRSEHYNASIVNFERIHDTLAILRVRPDDGPLSFVAGQYTTLGLGRWEPRLPDAQQEPWIPEERTRVVRRAYSISCRLLDESNRLATATDGKDLEFYVALVRTADHPPALTPRLFMLDEGDRLQLSRKCHGNYVLEQVGIDETIIFMATGTGEAPHNAMVAELLANGHRGRIVSVVCTRYRQDLAYEAKHRILEKNFGNYRYLTLTTREPENLDPKHPRFVGKRYLQDYLESGDFESAAELDLDPTHSRVYLCGGPDMIGVPLHTHDPNKRYPKPVGLVELLEKRGFRVSRPHERGNVHFEKYW